jgi:hypothetical protein
MRIFNDLILRRAIFVGMSSFAAMMNVGCQSDVGDIQATPDHYLTDGNIQYFPVVPKFKLSKEAAEMKAKREAHEKLPPTSTETTNELTTE